jgi:AraC-like DNA-binding protein
MNPLQLQKQLRLQEARRLMVGEGLGATSASYRVGYGKAAHFSREYQRRFLVAGHPDSDGPGSEASAGCGCRRSG